MMENTAAQQPLPRGLPGYAMLLRRNQDVRRLWIGQVISDMGDWFNTVAVLGLLQQLTGGALAPTLNLVLQMLPAAICGFFISGWVADRYDRRKIMIAAHLARALIALSYLFVRSPEWVFVIYIATVGLSIGQSFYQPAAGAAMPNLCRPGELNTAVALQLSSFASVVFIGAFIGGVIAQWLGRDVAFIINALSFLWAAFWTARVRGSFADPANKRKPQARGAAGVLTEGLRYLKRHPNVLMFALSKPVWAFTFGASGLFTAYSYTIYGMGDLGTSILYGCRGLGAFLGPLLLNVLVTPRSTADFARIMVFSNLTLMAGYMMFGLGTELALGAAGVVIGHVGGSSVWGFSRLYVQRETEDYIRGRVLSIDQMLFQLSTSLVTLGMGLLTTVAALPAIVLCGIGLTALLTLIWSTITFRLAARMAPAN